MMLFILTYFVFSFLVKERGGGSLAWKIYFLKGILLGFMF